MHLLVTDHLACPRCGPAFGLILRADRLEERRVHDGGLGCPNCRDVYPVVSGFGDLRPLPREAEEAEAPGSLSDGELDMVHALLGIVEGPAHVLAWGESARFAPGLAERIPDVEVLAIHPGLSHWTEAEGLSRACMGQTLALKDRSLRGVVLDGVGERAVLREAVRVLGAGGRVVLVNAGRGAGDHLIAAGLTLNLDQDGVVVASRPGGPSR